MAKREEKPGKKSASRKSGSGKSSRSSAQKKTTRGSSSKSSSSKSAKSGARGPLRKIRRKPAVLSPALEELLENSARDAAQHARTVPPQLPMRGIDPLPVPFVNRGAPLPEGYGLDRLVALARDPWNLFVYWELNGTRLRTLNRERGAGFIDACAWALRLHRIDEGVAHDIEIDSTAGCWYIQLDRQGRYQVELALLSPDGEWIALLASHVVTMPSEQPSQNIHEVWTPDDQPHAELDAEALRKLDELLWPEGLRSGSSGFVGASKVRSSFSSFSFVSSIGSLAQASSARVPGSWASSAGVSSFSSFNLGASSGKIPSSGGSGGSGGVQNFSGTTMENVDPNQHHTMPGGLNNSEDRPGFFGGPNWNAQTQLPPSGPGKSHQPHFKIKLPRILTGIPLPEPSWPSAPGNTRVLLRG